MKWMKWFLILVVGITVGLAAAGCGSSDDNDDPLVGTWRATTYNGQPMPTGISMTMTLSDNGTFSATTAVGADVETETGTWSAANGVLTTASDGETDDVPYSVSGDTLTFGTPGDIFTATRE